MTAKLPCYCVNLDTKATELEFSSNFTLQGTSRTIPALIFVDRLARVLHRIAQAASRSTVDGISLAIEHSDLIIHSEYLFPALMVEHHDVIGILFLDGDRQPGASLVEGLDDFYGLGPEAS